MIADLWGTAFLEAARRRVIGILDKKSKISNEFGPGFYGMDLMEMHKLALLSDASQIGLDIRKSGALFPVKSCAVILFEVTEDYKQPDIACRECLGSLKNCSLCSYNRR